MSPASDYACISLQMTDSDIVARVAAILGAKVNGPYEKEGRKTVWSVKVHGQRAIEWMFTLFTLMGERRRQQIEKAVAMWKIHRRPRPNRFLGTPHKKEKGVATCHPNKQVVGWGLCGACYMREWRAQRCAEIV
jgi:hypothetical protein